MASKPQIVSPSPALDYSATVSGSFYMGFGDQIQILILAWYHFTD